MLKGLQEEEGGGGGDEEEQGKEEEEEEEEKRKKNRGIGLNNKMALNMYLSIITLSVNGLNTPTKRHRVAEQIRKQNPYICCLQETHLRLKDTHSLKV